MARSYRKPRRVRKKKQRNWKRILVLLLFGLVLGAVLYTAFFSEFVQVRGVRLEGVENVDREALQERVVSLLEQRVLFWGTRSIFLLAPERVEQEVEQAFPCIASATADRLFWQRAFVLRVEERREEAVWCRETECFSVDKEGVVFQKSSPDTAILLIFPEEKKGKLGERIVEPGLLHFALFFKGSLTNLQLSSAEFVSPTRLNLTTSEGWQAYLDPTEDPKWQLTKLEALLKEELPPGKRSELQYVELRFGDQAYYQ